MSGGIEVCSAARIVGGVSTLAVGEVVVALDIGVGTPVGVETAVCVGAGRGVRVGAGVGVEVEAVTVK